MCRGNPEYLAHANNSDKAERWRVMDSKVSRFLLHAVNYSSHSVLQIHHGPPKRHHCRCLEISGRGRQWWDRTIQRVSDGQHEARTQMVPSKSGLVLCLRRITNSVIEVGAAKYREMRAMLWYVPSRVRVVPRALHRIETSAAYCIPISLRSLYTRIIINYYIYCFYIYLVTNYKFDDNFSIVKDVNNINFIAQ